MSSILCSYYLLMPQDHCSHFDCRESLQLNTAKLFPTMSFLLYLFFIVLFLVQNTLKTDYPPNSDTQMFQADPLLLTDCHIQCDT